MPVSPTGLFKYSLDSFYVTESPLIIAELATFYLNRPVLMVIHYGTGQLVQLVSLNTVLTVSMLQIDL